MISGKARTEAILRIIYQVMFFNKVILSEKLLLVFRCFTNRMVLFGFAKKESN